MNSAGPAFSSCDLCDAFRDEPTALRVLPDLFKRYGGRRRFAGPVATVACFEDNSLVKQLVESPGLGRVLVVDGGGSLRTALVGGNLAGAAARNGWAGVVVDGAVRDRAELAAADVGICALALCPMPPAKRGQGRSGEPVRLQGVVVRPGEWLYADDDGIVIAAQPLHGA
jgi:regulator of ribonuclease activity A